MADYNIYIHDVNGGSQNSSPTTAWTANESNQTKAWNPQQKSESEDGDFNLVSSAASFKGIKAAAKSHPVVAAAIVVVSIASKVMDTIAPFISRESGDYRFQTGWNNVKSTVKMGLDPFGTFINYEKSKQETRLFNKTQEQERLLIGESFSNGNNRKY